MRTALALAAFVLLSACAPGTRIPLNSMMWAPPVEGTELRVDLAEAMVDSDRPEAALKIIRHARTEGIDGPDLTVVQARALLAKELEGEAESLLDDIVRRYPRHAGAQAALGVLYLEQRRTGAATASLERAVHLSPGEARLHNNLGFAFLVSGRYLEAEGALREALRLDPSNARSRNNLGFALAALGRIEDAREEFRAVVGDKGADHNLRIAAQLYPSPEPSEAP